MAHEVFVSYSVKDRQFADALCHKLEEDGLRCWIAPRDISPGGNWAGEIADAIPKSQIMILIFSNNSNTSKQVLREVELAIANDIIIIPMKIEEVVPTGGMSYYLSTTHWIDAIGNKFDKRINSLSRKVQGMIDSGKEPVSESITKEKQKIPGDTIEQKPITEGNTIKASDTTDKKQNQKKEKRKVWPLVIGAVGIVILTAIGFFAVSGWISTYKDNKLAEQSQPPATEWKTLEKGTDYYAAFRESADPSETPEPDVSTQGSIESPEPTPVSTIEPTAVPDAVATTEPTAEPTAESTTTPTQAPTPVPTTAPTPMPTPQPEPANLSIARWEGNVFISEWAEFQIQMPEGWYKASDEEILLIYAIGIEILAGATDQDMEALASIDYAYPMFISKYPLGDEVGVFNTNLLISYEKLNPPNDILVGGYMYLSVVRSQYEDMDMGYEFIGDITEVQVAGKTYFLMTAENSSIEARQVFLCRKVDNFIIGIIISSAIDGQNEINMLIDKIEKY